MSTATPAVIPSSECEWDAVAAAWDARRDRAATMKAELTRQLLDRLSLSPGQHVLELGAGTGDLARRLAAAVTATGSVLASDVSRAFVSLIRTTTADLPQVSARQLDAGAIDLPEQSYDAAAFCMGLMHLLEPVTAMREIHRVLRPTGRVAVTTWAAPEHNAWLPSIARSMMSSGILDGQSPRKPGGVFSLCDPRTLQSVAHLAGFQDVIVTTVDDVVHYPSVGDYIEQATSFAPRLAKAYTAATPQQRAELALVVTEATNDYRTSEGALLFPTRALLLSASTSS